MGPRAGLEGCGKLPPLLGFDPRTVQPVASRYTDYAIGGAFDNALHPQILARLWKINCPPNIYGLVEDFLRERTAHVTQGHSVASKRVTKACPQGSVSGPTLWNIVINDLIALLSYSPNVSIVVYADDIMVMMQGSSPAEILNTLQSTLKILHKWCTEQRLEISKEKSALMPMFTRNRGSAAGI